MGDTGSIRRTCLQTGTFWHGFPPTLPRTRAKRPHVFPLMPAGSIQSVQLAEVGVVRARRVVSR